MGFLLTRPEVLVEHRPEKTPLVARDAPRLLGVAERCLALRVLHRLLAVHLVGREALKREQRQRDVVGALAGHEVAVVLAAELLDQRYPTQFQSSWPMSAIRLRRDSSLASRVLEEISQ